MIPSLAETHTLSFTGQVIDKVTHDPIQRATIMFDTHYALRITHQLQFSDFELSLPLWAGSVLVPVLH